MCDDELKFLCVLDDFQRIGRHVDWKHKANNQIDLRIKNKILLDCGKKHKIVFNVTYF